MGINAVTKSNILQQACKECGLDGHIKLLGLKRDATTWPEKVADGCRKMHSKMPVKSSFVFCDRLDMTFYFNHKNKACVSFSGYAQHGTRDLAEGKLQEAFVIAGKMVETMQKLIDEELTAHEL